MTNDNNDNQNATLNQLVLGLTGTSTLLFTPRHSTELIGLKFFMILNTGTDDKKILIPVSWMKVNEKYSIIMEYKLSLVKSWAL
jgi:hypothetical protein